MKKHIIGLFLATAIQSLSATPDQVLAYCITNGVYARLVPYASGANQIVMSDGSISDWTCELPIPDEKDLPRTEDAILIVASQSYPSPDITVPMVDADGDSVGTARILVDPDTMEVRAVINSASPQRTWSDQKAQLASNATERAAVVSALKVLKTTMTNSIAQAQAIDPAAWTGAQRTQMQAVRRVLIDQAQDCNAMRRALLRYLKTTED
jgi:hypothetical protein